MECKDCIAFDSGYVEDQFYASTPRCRYYKKDLREKKLTTGEANDFNKKVLFVIFIHFSLKSSNKAIRISIKIWINKELDKNY